MKGNVLILAETYAELMTNTAHIAFELSWEIITFIAMWPIAKWKARKEIRKHDAQHHPEHGHVDKHGTYHKD